MNLPVVGWHGSASSWIIGKQPIRVVYTQEPPLETGWQWQPHNEYHVKAGARGLSWAGAQPESESDYRARIDTVKQPYVSHETGQWCVFPNFNEIRKYTGVNKAKNFEIFRDILNDKPHGKPESRLL